MNLPGMIVRWLGAGVVVAAIVIYGLWPKAAAPAFFDGCRKAWSHRTLADGAPENSVEGLRRAFELGAAGVEIDVIYDERRAAFYVISGEAFAAGRSATLTLREMLAAVPPEGLLWLDFWNLKWLSDRAALQAAQLLPAQLQAAGMLPRALVESISAERLALFAERGVQTMLWLQIAPASDGHRRHLHSIVDAALRFRAGRFAAVSMDYTDYDRWVALVFARVPTHLFTVNDPGMLNMLARKSQIKAILTDLGHFSDFGCTAVAGDPGPHAPILSFPRSHGGRDATGTGGAVVTGG